MSSALLWITKSKKSSGFNIIEVVVAISILLLVLVCIITIFPFGASINRDAQQKTIALGLARAEIEKLTALSYEELIPGIIEPRARLSSDPNEKLYLYERQTEINYVDPSQNFQETEQDLDLKKIKTDVYWTSPLTHQEKNYHITTLISNH